MSKIQRYQPTVTEVKATAYCGFHPDGQYVSFADHDAAIAAKDAEIERLAERCGRLEAALRHIGSYNKDARHMVEKGFHNTTLAIDLSDHANAALAAAETEVKRVGCEDESGELIVHPENEVCHVCAPTSDRGGEHQ